MEENLKILKVEYLSNRWSHHPQMEDYLKILKVKYLSNHSLDFPQILNLSLVDQTKLRSA